MRVTIDIKDQKVAAGLFSDKIIHWVVLKVVFEQNEIGALKTAGVLDQVFIHWKDLKGNPNFDQDYTVKHLLKEGRLSLSYASLPEAQRASAEIESQLRSLKNAIEATSAPKSKTFEL